MGFPIENLKTTQFSSTDPEPRKWAFLDSLARWIAVAGGLGYSPVAPGTAGSLGAAILFLTVFFGSELWGPEFWGAGRLAVWLVGLLIFVMAGIWSASRAERLFGRKDDGRIVIDEVAGQWIALLPLICTPQIWNSDFSSILWGVVTGFVLFRVFDVWKPGAIRWAERRFTGGWGVMADDLIAGVAAAVVLAVGWQALLWSSLVSSGAGTGIAEAGA